MKDYDVYVLQARVFRPLRRNMESGVVFQALSLGIGAWLGCLRMQTLALSPKVITAKTYTLKY